MNDIQKQISKIIKSVVLCLSVAIGGAIVVAIFAAVAMTLSGRGEVSPMMIVVSILALGWIGVLIWTFVMYLSGIRGFGKRLDDIGNKAMQSAFWSNLVPIIGYVIMVPLFIFLPVLSVSFYILIIIATLVLYARAYLMLPRSTSLNELGVKGANKLKTSMILYLSTSVCGMIYMIAVLPSMLSMAEGIMMPMPTSGGWIAIVGIICFAMFILEILSLVFFFIGWSTMRKSFE